MLRILLVYLTALAIVCLGAVLVAILPSIILDSIAMTLSLMVSSVLMAWAVIWSV